MVITDQGNDMLTLLNGDTGEVVPRSKVKKRKFPESVTTDADRNVCVCYWKTSEASVLSGDLSEEKNLLSRQIQ